GPGRAEGRLVDAGLTLRDHSIDGHESIIPDGWGNRRRLRHEGVSQIPGTRARSGTLVSRRVRETRIGPTRPAVAAVPGGSHRTAGFRTRFLKNERGCPARLWRAIPPRVGGPRPSMPGASVRARAASTMFHML